MRTIVLLLALGGVALGQPGAPPPPGLLVKVQQSGRILDGQAPDLVWLEGVGVEDLETFTSQADRTHLRFQIVPAGERYSAIMYAFDWGEADRDRLASGRVGLVGLWDEYRGEPSFVVKWVEADAEDADAPDTASEGTVDVTPPSRTLVRIDDARPANVDKFVSRALRMHARFTFTVTDDPATYEGIVYEGDWDTELLDVLRSGQATMTGYWNSDGDEPFFVVQRVD